MWYYGFFCKAYSWILRQWRTPSGGAVLQNFHRTQPQAWRSNATCSEWFPAWPIYSFRVSDISTVSIYGLNTESLWKIMKVYLAFFLPDLLCHSLSGKYSDILSHVLSASFCHFFPRAISHFFWHISLHSISQSSRHVPDLFIVSSIYREVLRGPYILYTIRKSIWRPFWYVHIPSHILSGLNTLPFYLTFLLAFTLCHSIWYSFWHRYSDVLSHILCGKDTLTFYLKFLLAITFWHYIWHFSGLKTLAFYLTLTFSLHFSLTNILTFNLTFFLAYIPKFYLTFHSGIYSNIQSHILSGAYSKFYLAFLFWHIFWYSISQSVWPKYSAILSDISSRIYILSFYLIFFLA